MTSPAPAAPPTTHARRLLYLDGWRGVSILAVIAGHFFPIDGFDLARFGVEMFFVLSGRLMGDILFVERFALPDFFRRRISRVWPALFVFVAVMAVALWGAPAPIGLGPLDVLSALTFTINYVCIFVHRLPMVEHLWSLCIEEWGYVLLGIVAFTVRRTSLDPVPAIAVLAGLAILDGAVLTLLHRNYFDAYWRTDVRVASILMASLAFLLARPRLSTFPPWSAPALMLLGILLNLAIIPNPVKYSAGTFAIALALAVIDRSPPALLRAMAHPILVQFGLWSFSLYLWQQPIYQVGWMLPPASWPVALLIRFGLVALVVGLGIASFRLVERPARRYLNSRWTAPPAPA